jgi:hypothetical protein
MNFEDWDDYVPVNDLVEKPKTINNNIIELKKDDNIDFIGISKENFDELFVKHYLLFPYQNLL